MRRAVIAATAVAVLILPGCAGPRPPVPPRAAVAVPPVWRAGAFPGRPIPADWWAAFGDAVLPGLVEQALVGNPDIAVAVSRVDQARAQERASHALLAPQVNLSAPGSYARALNAFGVATTTASGQPGVAASYELDLFGALRSADAAARAQILASQGARDTVRLAVVSSAVSAYLTLRALDARLTIARDTLALRADSLRIARRQAQTGYTSDLELHQAEAEFAATQQLVPQLELAVSQQENALNLLLGSTAREVPRGSALTAMTLPSIPDGLPADLLRRRPDLFQAEQTLVAADRSLDSARASLLPKLSLTGSGGLVLSSALSDPVGVFSLGGSILAPLFDGGRLRAQRDVAAAQRDQAAYAYQKATLTAFREVEDALAGVQRSGEQVDALTRQRAALAAALRNATNRYRAGYSSYLEQLDAQRGLLNAELTLVQAQADRLTNYVSLYQAMGGGWTTSG